MQDGCVCTSAFYKDLHLGRGDLKGCETECVCAESAGICEWAVFPEKRKGDIWLAFELAFERHGVLWHMLSVSFMKHPDEYLTECEQRAWIKQIVAFVQLRSVEHFCS